MSSLLETYTRRNVSVFKRNWLFSDENTVNQTKLRFAELLKPHCRVLTNKSRGRRNGHFPWQNKDTESLVDTGIMTEQRAGWTEECTSIFLPQSTSRKQRPIIKNRHENMAYTRCEVLCATSRIAFGTRNLTQQSHTTLCCQIASTTQFLRTKIEHHSRDFQHQHQW